MFADTGAVVMVNGGDVIAPAAIVTDCGTVAIGSLLVSVTMAPVDGAGLLSVTVLSVVERPPAIVDADRLTAATAGGLTVKVAVAVLP